MKDEVKRLKLGISGAAMPVPLRNPSAAAAVVAKPRIG